MAGSNVFLFFLVVESDPVFVCVQWGRLDERATRKRVGFVFDIVAFSPALWQLFMFWLLVHGVKRRQELRYRPGRIYYSSRRCLADPSCPRDDRFDIVRSYSNKKMRRTVLYFSYNI